MKKIVVATPLYPPEIGGPATYTTLLETEFARRHVAIEVLPFSLVRHLPKGVAHFAYFTRAFRALLGADIAFALDPVSVGLPTFFAALFARKKFVVRIAGDRAWEEARHRFNITEQLEEFVEHGPHELPLRIRVLWFAERFIARRADGVIVPSRYLRDIIVKWGVPPERVTVIYNAFDDVPALPDRALLRERYGWKGKVIFSAGRLVEWKGFPALIELMPTLREAHPDLSLFIAGSGPLAHELHAEIKRHGIPVHLLGDVPRLQLLEYVHAADCFVLNTAYEGFSHQILEALALGTPVVTTSVGGNVELVEDGVTGVLVHYNDTNALRVAISGILADPAHALSMGEAGKRFVARFSAENMAEETLKCLRGLTHSS